MEVSNGVKPHAAKASSSGIGSNGVGNQRKASKSRQQGGTGQVTPKGGRTGLAAQGKEGLSSDEPAAKKENMKLVKVLPQTPINAKKNKSGMHPKPSGKSQATEDDAFEEYDVDPSQKEFLLELLKVAPKEELIQLVGNTKMKRKRDDDAEDGTLDTKDMALAETVNARNNVDLGHAVAAAASRVGEIVSIMQTQFACEPPTKLTKRKSKKQRIIERDLESPKAKINEAPPKLQEAKVWYKDDNSGAMEVDVVEGLEPVLTFAPDDPGIQKKKKNAILPGGVVQKSEHNQKTLGDVIVPVPAVAMGSTPASQKKSHIQPATGDANINGSGTLSTTEKQKPQKVEKQEKKKPSKGLTTSEYFSPSPVKKQPAKQIASKENATKDKQVQQPQGKKAQRRAQSLVEAGEATKKLASMAGLPKEIVDMLRETNRAIQAANIGGVVKKAVEQNVARNQTKNAQNKAKGEGEKARSLNATEAAKIPEKSNKRAAKRERARQRNHNRLREQPGALGVAIDGGEKVNADSTETSNALTTEKSSATCATNDSEARDSVQSTENKLASSIAAEIALSRTVKGIRKTTASEPTRMDIDPKPASQELKANHSHCLEAHVTYQDNGIVGGPAMPDTTMDDSSGNIDISEDVRSSNAPASQEMVDAHTHSEVVGSIDRNDTLQPNEPRATEGVQHDKQTVGNRSIGNNPLYNSMGNDQTGDELNESPITPTPRRRTSSASQRSAPEAGYFTQNSPKIQRLSKSSPSSQPLPRTPAPKIQQKSILEIILNSPAEEAKPKLEKWLDPSHMSGKKSRAVRRDSNGRFSAKGLVITPTESTKRPSVDASTGSPLKVEGAEADMSVNAFDDRILQADSSATPNRPIFDEESPISKTQNLVEDGGPENGSFIKLEKKVKAKRASKKSPYFTAPVISQPKRATSKAAQGSEDISERTPKSTPTTPKKKGDLKSETPKRRSPGGIVSCIPFPPLSSPHFGLIQEKLAHDPFRLLIAVTFLNRTKGKDAIPVFYELLTKYPTPESLVSAGKEDIVPIIRHLGLQNQRAATYQTYAKFWLEDPPKKGRRYAVRGYPTKESGRDIKNGEILADDDEREAWEIGHMTQGPYAIDSWRIFCRDALRGKAKDWNGEGNTEECFQPEWMRVLPEDKELRAYLRWMWLKEGFEWDPFTGEKEVAGKELMSAAIEGRIAWDDFGGMRIIMEGEDSGSGAGIGEPLNHDVGPMKDDVKGKGELTETEDMDWEI
ncbi:uncharacterized protein BP5553_00008 [Venustampulla echinocandica]|uniref:HhH-GPD domain-containing protein n=1 Tax=Venustampulla echinocandica TaxID=2656787 RepID=A0A370TWY0_9HELO|nr:uncharacterized protein BP5553_00008 [Venustampulla echinocandica]RDL40029.1 hypothetical protein BP5553_00008 [Venustampulla echinocandica]